MPHSLERTVRFTRFMLPVVALILASCASTGEADDPNIPETCVTVDNTSGGGNAGRVFLVGSRGRDRIRIGEVTMGRMETLCVRRSTFGGPWQLVIESGTVDRMDPALRQNSPNAFRSQEFTLQPGDHLVWDIRLNRITLRSSGGSGG